MLQVGVALKDLEAATKNDGSFGIGPREIDTRNALALRDMTASYERQEFAS